MGDHQSTRRQRTPQMDQRTRQVIHSVEQADHHNQIKAGERIGLFKIEVFGRFDRRAGNGKVARKFA
jgi:hypothetical protein